MDQMKRFKLIISFTVIMLPLLVSMTNCNRSNHSTALNNDSSDTGPRNTGLSVSVYNPYDFDRSSLFPGVPGAQGGVAVSQFVLGAELSCVDSFVEYDYYGGHFEDVEDNDLPDAGVSTDEEYVQKALLTCGCDETTGQGPFCSRQLADRCITKIAPNRYKVNKPNCQPISGSDKLYKLTNEQTGVSATVFIETTCPLSHWKNMAKNYFGVDDFHCAKPHVDLSTSVFAMLGITDATQSSTSVSLIPLSQVGIENQLPSQPQIQQPQIPEGCDYSKAAQNYGSGYNYATGQSCPPLQQ